MCAASIKLACFCVVGKLKLFTGLTGFSGWSVIHVNEGDSSQGIVQFLIDLKAQ